MIKENHIGYFSVADPVLFTVGSGIDFFRIPDPVHNSEGIEKSFGV